jgi:hypothetical protein
MTVTVDPESSGFTVYPDTVTTISLVLNKIAIVTTFTVITIFTAVITTFTLTTITTTAITAAAACYRQRIIN